MNKDELLNKYFNNELDESELAQFNELLANDNAFATEFQRLNKVEHSLNGLASQLTIDDLAFIKQTGDNLVNVGHTASASTSSAGSSIMNLKVFLTSAVVISLVAILSYFGYKAFLDKPATNETHTTVQKEQKPATAIKAIETQTSVQTDYEIIETPEEIQIIQKDTEDKGVEPAIAKTEQTKTGSPDELKGRIKDINPVKNRDIITQLQNELNDYRRNGDLLNEIWTLKRLGIFYRQLGDFTQSEHYLNKALDGVLQLNNPTLTAEIYGEMACLYFENKKKDKAADYKNKCLELLETNSSKRAAYWQKKFKKFQ